MPANLNDRRRNGWMLPVALGLLAGGGCSHFGRNGSHPPNGPPEYSTIGTDRSKIPRGQTIPPAGFGVDLVESSRGPSSRPAAMPPPGTTGTRDPAVTVAGW